VTVDAVLTALDEVVARARDAGDRRGYFAVLYRTVTERVKEGLETGYFDDAERMERLDVLFADRYLEAERAWLSGARPTESWALTFDAASRWRPLVVQHLLVGINAPINLDLGIAAARCSPGDELPGLRRDYDRINAILATMIARFEANLRSVSPWMGLLDTIGARTREGLIGFSITTARAGAWRFAESLAHLPDDGWDEPIADRDARVARVGHGVLHPGFLSTGLLAVRLRERNDVRATIDALAATPAPTLAEVEAQVDTAGPGA
jgi:hypothetical protein